MILPHLSLFSASARLPWSAACIAMKQSTPPITPKQLPQTKKLTAEMISQV